MIRCAEGGPPSITEERTDPTAPIKSSNEILAPNLRRASKFWNLTTQVQKNCACFLLLCAIAMSVVHRSA